MSIFSCSAHCGGSQQSSFRVISRQISAESGFSLFELLAVIAIVSIITAIAIGNFEQLQSSFHRNDIRQQLAFDIHRARAEATEAGGRAVIGMISDGNAYQVGVDYYPYNDPAEFDSMIFQRQMPTGYILESSQTIIFDSRGMLVDDTGALTNTTIQVSAQGDVVFSGDLYPTGYLEVDPS